MAWFAAFTVWVNSRLPAACLINGANRDRTSYFVRLVATISRRLENASRYVTAALPFGPASCSAR